jgi:hypothetical protein
MAIRTALFDTSPPASSAGSAESVAPAAPAAAAEPARAGAHHGGKD